MSNTIAYFLGYGLLWLFALGVIAFGAYLLLEFIGEEIFTRMRRVYHLSSIVYWLNRYEKEGRKCFLTPEEGDRI